MFWNDVQRSSRCGTARSGILTVSAQASQIGSPRTPLRGGLRALKNLWRRVAAAGLWFFSFLVFLYRTIYCQESIEEPLVPDFRQIAEASKMASPSQPQVMRTGDRHKAWGAHRR